MAICTNQEEGFIFKTSEVLGRAVFDCPQIERCIIQDTKSPRTKCKIVHFNRLKKYKGQDCTTWLDSLDPDVRIIAQEEEREPKAEIKQNNWDAESESSNEEDMPVSQVLQPSSKSSCEINQEGPEVPSPNKSEHSNTLRALIRPRRIIKRPKRLIEEI